MYPGAIHRKKDGKLGGISKDIVAYYSTTQCRAAVLNKSLRVLELKTEQCRSDKSESEFTINRGHFYLFTAKYGGHCETSVDQGLAQ